MSAFLVNHRTIDSILSEVPNQLIKTYHKKAIENLLFGPDSSQPFSKAWHASHFNRFKHADQNPDL